MAGDLAARIGRRIAARRAELSLTQGQLAAQVGTDAVNNQRISDWERGVNRPSDRYMAEIASALDRPVAWFFEDEDAGGTPDLMAVLPKDDVRQMDRIEAKLDRLLRHFAIDDYEDPPTELLSTRASDAPKSQSDQRSDSAPGTGSLRDGAG